jgi:hypothetical protein
MRAALLYQNLRRPVSNFSFELSCSAFFPLFKTEKSSHSSAECLCRFLPRLLSVGFVAPSLSCEGGTKQPSSLSSSYLLRPPRSYRRSFLPLNLHALPVMPSRGVQMFHEDDWSSGRRQGAIECSDCHRQSFSRLPASRVAYKIACREAMKTGRTQLTSGQRILAIRDGMWEVAPSVKPEMD